jgi:site-specific DNA-methyltransferase (adenine-specific)
MKPYYERDGITIYHADCRDVLPTLAAGSVDLVLTDPPYGVGKAEWDDDLPLWWLDEATRIAPCLGLMPSIKHLLRYPSSVGALRYRWTLSAHLINGMTAGPIGFGNWVPCLVYSADGIRIHQQLSDVGRVVVGRDTKPDHPSPKPYEAMRWFVSRFPNADTILDPFMGSGTTLRAAKDLGRRAIGIEIEERYCEIAARRLEQSVLPLAMAAEWGE